MTTDDEYTDMLGKLCTNFEEKLNTAGGKVGYIFIVDRDPKSKELDGCIDIATNLPTANAIHALEALLAQLKEEQK